MHWDVTTGDQAHFLQLTVELRVATVQITVISLRSLCTVMRCNNTRNAPTDYCNLRNRVVDRINWAGKGNHNLPTLNQIMIMSTCIDPESLTEAALSRTLSLNLFMPLLLTALWGYTLLNRAHRTAFVPLSAGRLSTAAGLHSLSFPNVHHTNRAAAGLWHCCWTADRDAPCSRLHRQCSFPRQQCPSSACSSFLEAASQLASSFLGGSYPGFLFSPSILPHSAAFPFLLASSCCFGDSTVC